jgi:hypothetical protein
MRTDLFTKRYLRCGKTITRKTVLGWGWNDRFRFASLTKYIDYKCKFVSKKEDGIVYTGCTKEKYITCCCGNCYNSVGYLSQLPNSYGDIQQIARCFSVPNVNGVWVDKIEKLGFWRRGKGCILPREYRSNTCIVHACHKLSPVAGELIKILTSEYEKALLFAESKTNINTGTARKYIYYLDAYYDNLKQRLIDENS